MNNVCYDIKKQPSQFTIPHYTNRYQLKMQCGREVETHKDQGILN